MDDCQRLIHKYEMMVDRVISLNKELESLIEEHKLIDATRNFLIAFTEEMREKIKTKLESLVNSALAAVFTDKKMEFKIFSNRTKQGLRYDLYIYTDNNLTPVTDAKGGGVLDIITLALRISFVKLFSGQLRQVVILDEPFKNLDGVRLPNAVEWLNQISKELEIQFIAITHISDLIDTAEKTFCFVLKDGVTEILEYARNK